MVRRQGPADGPGALGGNVHYSLMSAKGSGSKRNAHGVNPFRLAELRSIVGPSLDNTSLVNLLKRADGVIEKAVNFYFDNERIRAQALSASVPEQKLACSTKLQKGLDIQTQEPTKCEGVAESGQDNSKMNGENVNALDEADWPKFLGTINVMAYTTVDLDAEKLPGKTQIIVCRRTSPTECDGSSRKASRGGIGSARRFEKRDYILRWKIEDKESRECGRFPSDVSKPVAILLDAGWIEADGCTLCEPDSSRKFANVPIALNIRMKCFSAPSTSDESDLASAHEAMIRLLEILGYMPRIPSEVELSLESAAKIDSPVSHEHLDTAQPHRCASENSEGRSEVDGEGVELSKEHVDILFNEDDQFSWKLPEEPQPASMHTVLRDYQRQVVFRPAVLAS